MNHLDQGPPLPCMEYCAKLFRLQPVDKVNNITPFNAFVSESNYGITSVGVVLAYHKGLISLN